MLPLRQQAKLARGAKDKERAMSQTPNTAIAVIGTTLQRLALYHATSTTQSADGRLV